LKTAYREAFPQFSAGTVLFWFAAQYLLRNDAIREIDHQIGVEEYKLRWAGRVRGQRHVFHAFNPYSVRAALERWVERYAAPCWRFICRAIKYRRYETHP